MLPPGLSEIGISKMRSSRWQALPEEVFEEIIQESKERAVPDLSAQALPRNTFPIFDISYWAASVHSEQM
jgi:hypothetical protein